MKFLQNEEVAKVFKFATRARNLTQPKALARRIYARF